MIVSAAQWEVTMPRPIRISPHEIDTSTCDLHLYQAYSAALAWCHTARTRLGGPDRMANRAPIGRWLAAVGLDAAPARDLLHGVGLGCHGSGTDLAGERVPAAMLHRVRRSLY
jgi:hypothetical protein